MNKYFFFLSLSLTGCQLDESVFGYQPSEVSSSSSNGGSSSDGGGGNQGIFKSFGGSGGVELQGGTDNYTVVMPTYITKDENIHVTSYCDDNDIAISGSCVVLAVYCTCDESGCYPCDPDQFTDDWIVTPSLGTSFYNCHWQNGWFAKDTRTVVNCKLKEN